MSQIHIAYASDDNYAQHMGCSITSVLANAKPEDELFFYIIDNNISESNKQKLMSLQSIRSCTIQILSGNTQVFDGARVYGHLTISAYLRLLLPELLPNLDRIIYLDCDTIINTSLEELWNSNLQHSMLGAVPDGLKLGENPKMDPCNRQATLKLKRCYFNSGVLLLDLAKIRQTKIFTKAIQWAVEHSELSLLHDQDALNVVLNDDYTILPDKWNFQYTVYYANEYGRSSTSLIDDDNLLKKQCIIHYTSEHKPWQYFYFYNISGKIYRDYLALTPWKDYDPVVPNFAARFKHFRRRNAIFHFFKTLERIIRKSIIRKKK